MADIKTTIETRFTQLQASQIFIQWQLGIMGTAMLAFFVV